MNKISLILNTAILLGLSILYTSCESDERLENLTPTTVYLVSEGIQPVNMYDKGENTTYTYKLDLYKAGALDEGVEVEIGIMSEDELTDYNIDNDTDYEFLDPGAYKIERFNVSFSSDRANVNELINIVFDPSKLGEEDTNKVLPIKIKSSTAVINPQKDFCIIHPLSSTPLFRLESPKVETINYVKGTSAVASINIETILDIDKNDWDIELELELDMDYIDKYNLQHGTSYTYPDPDMFSLESKKTLQAGNTTLSFGMNIFQRYLNGSYLLPVRLKQSSMFEVEQDVYQVVILNIIADYLPKDDWTVIDFNTQELSGEGSNGRAEQVIDGKNDTYWHSRWQGGTTPLPHWLVIDMQSAYTLTEINLVKREGYNHARAGEFWISEDNSNWTKIGDFVLDQIEGEQPYTVTETSGRYLKVIITESRNWDGATSLAEVSPRGY